MLRSRRPLWRRGAGCDSTMGGTGERGPFVTIFCGAGLALSIEPLIRLCSARPLFLPLSTQVPRRSVLSEVR